MDLRDRLYRASVYRQSDRVVPFESALEILQQLEAENKDLREYLLKSDFSKNPNPNVPGQFRDFSKDPPEMMDQFIEKEYQSLARTLRND